MTEFSAVSLRIETVGEREAMNALNDLDKNGRKIVEGVSAATGRAMGDIAAAYDSGTKRIRQQLKNIADDHYTNIRAMEAEQRAAEKAVSSAADQTDRLAMRNEHAIASASRGLEMLGRTGQLTGRSLDAVVGQVSQMAFAFGPGGQLVAAIGISTAAIVEMFMRTSREAKKTADEAVKEFDRIAHASVAAQGKEAGLLYSGDANSTTPYKAASLAELNRLRKVALEEQEAGIRLNREGLMTMSAAAKAATDNLAALNIEIDRRNKLLASITTGSLPRAAAEQVREDQPGFISDKLKAEDTASKRLAAEAKRRAKEIAKEAEAYQKEMLSDARDAAAQMVKDAQFHDDFINGLLGLPSKTEQKAAMAEAKFEIGELVRESIKNDPFLNAKKDLDKSIKSLADHMKEALGKTLGEGLTAGFETAFAGKGIGNAFKSLTATVLAGLGGFLEQLGGSMLITGVWLTAFSEAMHHLNGPAAIAAGVGLIAAGAALKAVAGSFGGDSSRGGQSANGSGGSAPMEFLSFGVKAGTSASVSSNGAPDAKPSMTFNVFGNDPKVQRDIGTVVESAIRRGLIPSLA